MAQLLADENIPVQLVNLLNSLGHDTVTMQQIGLAGQAVSDQRVLETATTLNRCVITFNRKDFIRLHTQVIQHSGIIVCTIDKDYSALSQRIHRRLTEYSDLAGQLLRVQRPNLSA